MKNLVFIFFLLTIGILSAEGPLFLHKETFVNQEFDNVYQDMRGVKSKTSAIVSNVKDYGAKGDGIADDSAAVNAACNDIGIGVLYFPRGTYKVNVNIGKRRCSILGDDLGTKFVSVSTSAFMISFSTVGLSGGNGARRFVRDAYFQGSNGFTDRGIYINAPGFISVQNCRFNDLEYGVYKNSSEWINYQDCTWTGCKYGAFSTTKNNDVIGNNPTANINSAEDYFNQCMFLSNTIAYYSEGGDNTHGDSTHASSFVSSNFVSNSLALAGGDAGNVGYEPMALYNCYFEDNNPGGTITVNGNVLTNGNISFNGGSLSIDHGFFLNGPVTITGQSYVTGNDVKMNEGSISISTETLSFFNINGLVGDRNSGFSTEALVPTGLAPYSGDRPAFAVIPNRTAWAYSLGSVVSDSGLLVSKNSIGQSTLGIKSAFPIPYVSTPIISVFYGDGLYANTCFKITGSTGNGVYWEGFVSSSSYYVTTFSIREDTNTVGSMPLQMLSGATAVTPANAQLNLSKSWKTYGSVGFSNTTGQNQIVFKLLQNGTFYVDAVQQVDFPTLREAIAFYDSSTYVLKKEEISNREFASSQAPTTGDWIAGDITWNNFSSTNTFIGWVCISSGTPGTWRTFGAVTP